MNNPFNEGTKIWLIFSLLQDMNWHCGKHELPGTQPAKAIQIIRQHGYDIENKTILCEICKDKTVHRRLTSIEPVNLPINRLALSQNLRKRVLNLYHNTEAITLRQETPNLLEVDHRFPQVRWSEPESFDENMSDEELKNRFQLLTRANNLWKSRYCERCKLTSQRGTFIGINYFYEGNEFWDKNIPDDDERGCEGCFWYNPEKWRKSLNDLIQKEKTEL